MRLYLVHIRALLSLFYEKIPTNALMYVSTTLFKLIHSYMFQHLRGHPQGKLTYFVGGVNKYVPRCKYQIKDVVC